MGSFDRDRKLKIWRKPMVRSILGVLAGMVLGCVLIALIQQISLALYPLAEGMDP